MPGSWPETTQTSGNLVFNGDDALVLYRGSEIIDSVGQVGGGSGHGLGLRQRLDPGHDPCAARYTVTIGRSDDVAFDPAQYVAPRR